MAKGADTKTSLSLVVILYFAPLLCVLPKGQIFFRWDGQIYPVLQALFCTWNFFLPPLKIESAPDKKDPGHAFDSSYYWVFMFVDQETYLSNQNQILTSPVHPIQHPHTHYQLIQIWNRFCWLHICAGNLLCYLVIPLKNHIQVRKLIIVLIV